VQCLRIVAWAAASGRHGAGGDVAERHGGCGHWVQLEKFDEFNRLAIGFMEGDEP
jgi:hypothetical protein